jgi:hypothetical protein
MSDPMTGAILPPKMVAIADRRPPVPTVVGAREAKCCLILLLNQQVPLDRTGHGEKELNIWSRKS